MKMMMKRIVCILIFLMPSLVFGLDLEPIATIDSPITKVEKIWDGPVEFILWPDSDTVVYARRNGVLNCYSISNKAERWTQEIKVEIRDLALGTSSFFVLGNDENIRIFNVADGELLNTLVPKQLIALVKSQYWSPIRITTIPGTNQLVIATNTKDYSDNTYVLDITDVRLLDKLKSEGCVYKMHISSNGGDVVTTTNKNIRIWSLNQKREIFHLGDDKSAAIDEPFISDAMFDGEKILIYSIDNSWGKGIIQVFDIVQKKEFGKFGSHNGHVVMDVDWKRKRIALTGNSLHLYVVDFAGNVLAELNNASKERIMVVKFSPDGSKIALGGRDNTVRVFSLKETNDDHEKGTDRGTLPSKVEDETKGKQK